MSLCLNNGTVPGGLETKAMSSLFGREVRVGEYRLSLEDFVCLAEYVLTNTDLREEDDPRLALVDKIRNSTMVKGCNPGGYRLQIG